MQKLAAFLNSDSDKNFPFATDLGWLMASEVIASGLDISFRDMSSDRIYTSQRNP